MNFRITVIVGTIMLLLLSGFDEADFRREQVRQREDIRRLQEKISQLQNDVRAVQTENESLKSEISRLKADFASLQEAHVQHRKEIERLDGLIRKLEEARQEDRKVIVEEVSREIARIKKGNGKEDKSKSAVEEGLEHVVNKGESLFAIAKAYGVTVKSIKEANQLKTNELKTGQKLFIPRK